MLPQQSKSNKRVKLYTTGYDVSRFQELMSYYKITSTYAFIKGLIDRAYNEMKDSSNEE